ncbi:insulinase family protein [Glutamicibacter sp. MNS18]|uniref:M16 family metallopeptidase n=1 Tax=Glutamicibacter sp. MNS18 TaxID=2989817 RepID=UPI002235720E|nr:pitrilysin family protein [Glutamicibacter sp. MNS18]MCW4465318.1 insulinase family protein [Glutamicibacter sp. MNS18]
MVMIPLPLHSLSTSEFSSVDPADPTLVHRGDGGSEVRRSILPGGVRVLTEAMPGQRSTTVGFWVPVGSRDETEGHHGSTHFLEHLLFKGTKKRSALDIAQAFDEVGGEANAATAKESTCYYARVLDADLPLAMEVIADMVTSAVLDPQELEQERGVIIEEIAMDADDATDVAHEKFVQAVLGEHPLGRPIGGTPEEIMSTSREAVLEHYHEHYRPSELIITAAGSLQHDEVCRMVLEALTEAGWELDPLASPEPRRNAEPAQITSRPGLELIKRPVEQANIIVGCTGITGHDPRRHTLAVLNSVLGGGMSSRLFQEIREKRGLVYSTYSFSAAYSDAGYFGMYAGCTPSKTGEVVKLLVAELEKLAGDGITEEELRKAKGQLSGGTVLALEDPGSRMSRLGRAEMITGEFQDLDEALARVAAVTREDVQDLARELVGRPRTITVVGPFETEAELGL